MREAIPKFTESDIALLELASRYPTSSGIYHWSFRLLKTSGSRKLVSCVEDEK
jgi:hypothetical protein